MIRPLLAALFLGGAPACAEVPVENYNLERAVKSAVDNSARAQLAERDITIAEQRVKEAKLRFFPEVGMQASATKFSARRAFAIQAANRSHLLFPSVNDTLYSGGAYAALNLYDGRRHINTLRLAQTALKQAKAKHDIAQLSVVYETQQAFYGILLSEALLTGLDDILAAAEKAAVQTESNPWQKVEAEALAAELRSERARRQHELEEARLGFLRALNAELDRPFRLEGKLQTQPVDVELRKALVWATELRPEMQSQTYKAQMDAIGVNLELGRRYPSVDLGVDYEITGEQFPLKQNNWDATVGIRIPFSIDFWTQHTQRVAEQRQAEIQRAELRDQVHLEVRKAHQDLAHWQGEWSRREKEYLALRDLFDRARNSPARPLDVFRAADRVWASLSSHLQALHEHILARARLERAIGRPLSGGS